MTVSQINEWIVKQAFVELVQRYTDHHFHELLCTELQVSLFKLLWGGGYSFQQVSDWFVSGDVGFLRFFAFLFLLGRLQCPLSDFDARRITIPAISWPNEYVCAMLRGFVVAWVEPLKTRAGYPIRQRARRSLLHEVFLWSRKCLFPH